MSDKQVNKEFWKDFDNVVNQCLVPRFADDTVRPCAEEDFQEYRKTLIGYLQSIESMLDTIVQNEEQLTTETKKNLLKVVIIIGEQNCKNPWNTEEIVRFCNLLTLKVCKIFKSENLTQILRNEDFFLSTVMFLRSKLMKDTWKSFPAAVICYKTLLELIEKPLLKRHLPEILPTALIIFDDYIQENQKLGLECISLIIQHCQQSRALKNLNYDQVIFEALEKMAHRVEPCMIISLYSCISHLLENMEFCQDDRNAFTWSKRDEVLIILLGNMELQSNSEARYAYVISLQELVTHSSCGKWSERIGRIIGEYCEDNTNMKTTEASLNFLKYYLALYTPQSQNFYVTIYSSLLKLNYNVNTCKNASKEVVEGVQQCIHLLNKLCPSISKELMSNSRVCSIMCT